MSKSKKQELFYIMNPNCGWCKKSDPVVDELIKNGFEITTLDVSNQEEAQQAKELQSKHEVRCGTPLFIESETGNMVCGFREVDVLTKWANGEVIPAPSRPKPNPNADKKQQVPTQPQRKLAQLEYIWVDSDNQIRNKTRYIPINFGTEDNPLPFESIMTQIPQWTFDGSSTGQSDREDSDLILKPVRFFGNPFINPQPHSVSYIVLCEVFNSDDTPHETNTRANLRELVDSIPDSNDMWFGLEQEYVFVDENGTIDNWSKNQKPQGDYYCGSGGNNVSNDQRQIVETHAQFCTQSGVNIGGTNAEVMKSQWEYQLNPAPAISQSDQLLISRYILNRLAEVRGKYVSFDPKPIEGDWNGSGCHINFSNKKMREEGGKEYIEEVCLVLKDSHDTCIGSYGSGNERRLTGEHETAKYDEFTWSDCDRGVSVRIPLTTVKNEYRGHIEDRRPSANIDPYKAIHSFIESVEVLSLEKVA